MMRQDAKSLALFRAIHAKLQAMEDPRPALERALVWARHFYGERPEDRWLGEWIGFLEAALESETGMQALYQTMLREDEYGITMRSSSPFPGVLTVRERTQVLKSFEREWND